MAKKTKKASIVYNLFIDKLIKILYNKNTVNLLRRKYMRAKEIVRRAMEIDQITQFQLAKELKWKSQQQVSQILTRKDGSMRVDTFVEMLRAMGYEVVVRKRLGKSEEWEVD
jgi:hypothetical protein